MNRRVCEHCHQQFKTDTGHDWHLKRIHRPESNARLGQLPASLEKKGYVPCPACAKSATVSTSRSADNDSVYVGCQQCATQVVLRPCGSWARIVLEAAKPHPVEGDQGMPSFIVWDCDMANAEPSSRNGRSES